MDRLAGASQLITLSSTSIHSKIASDDPAERALSARLAESEEHIFQAAGRIGLPVTVLRPTMIYDCETDRSINQIASVIRRFGFFAIAGSGRGLRQPIHARDVAEAIFRSIGNHNTMDKTLDLTGGETISYRTMVERIARGLGRKSPILSVPTFALKSLVYIVRSAGMTRHSPSFIDRMNEDLAYDNSEAIARLGFTPRGFDPEFRGH